MGRAIKRIHYQTGKFALGSILCAVIPNNKKELSAEYLYSDILPYEIPITFSNRHFYDFVIKNKVKIEGEKISAPKADATDQEIIKLLFGIRQAKSFNAGKINFEKENRDSIPFGYKIA